MISIQLTEVPANETVTNRVFSLPESGGNFGSAFDCFMPLPDRSGQVAAVHGQFVPTQQGMSIESLHGGEIRLNGVPLAPGRLATIEDGTIIEVAAYTILISQIADELLSEKTGEVSDVVESNNDQNQVHFSLTGLAMDNNDDVVMHTNEPASNNQLTQEQNQAIAQSNTHFSASGVFADDPFGEDPFAEEDISWQSENTTAINRNNEQQANIYADITSSTNDDLAGSQANQNAYEHSTTEAEVLPLKHFKQEAKVDQLVELLDRQIATANEQQNMLFQALDKTLATFLDEFSPQHLEETYDDYGRPLFVGKEQQYWRLYRKSFHRRLSKGEYQRLFKALLLENMQTGQD